MIISGKTNLDSRIYLKTNTNQTLRVWPWFERGFMVDISKHELVPKHEILSPAEKKELFENFNITKEKLPKIFSSDPALVDKKASHGDVVKITRKSPTAGQAIYYRVVVED